MLAEHRPTGSTGGTARPYIECMRNGTIITLSLFLAPLLAGLTELVPWLKQWYDAPNPDPTLDRAGTQIEALAQSERRALARPDGQIVARFVADGFSEPEREVIVP